MASKHQLSLDIVDTNNPCIIKIYDSSIYSEVIPVECATLQIIVPGFNKPVKLEVEENFTRNITSCDLYLQTQNCGTDCVALPDGVYNIQYTVAPNDKVYVEYEYLRMTQFLEKYYKQFCKLEMAACEPNADVKDSLKELRLIKSFADAAKAKIEYCHETSVGMDLFHYAKKRLDKFAQSCGDQCH
jgi:hypothetical protein